MKKFDAVVFDLDSTLVNFEGLDWLAEIKGKGEEVVALTKLSMEGRIKVNEAFEKKIAIIAPSYQDFVLLGEKYSESLVTGAQEVIDALQEAGVEVWIVTGNFNPAVEIVAKRLGIASDRIFCNEIVFDEKGDFESFDSSQILSNNGGKKGVIKDNIKGDKRVVHIGDAITDLEAKEVVDLFVGFGGVEMREIVKSQSEVYIEENSLLPVLDLILTTR